MASTYLSICAIFLTVVGLLIQHFCVLSAIKERLVRLETKMELFWGTIETNVSKMLKTYPTNIRKDILLDKFANKELVRDEAFELRTILIGELEATGMKRQETLAYILVIARIDQIIPWLKKEG